MALDASSFCWKKLSSNFLEFVSGLIELADGNVRQYCKHPGALTGLPYVRNSQTFSSVSGDTSCCLEVFVLKLCIVSPAFVGSSVNMH